MTYKGTIITPMAVSLSAENGIIYANLQPKPKI